MKIKNYTKYIEEDLINKVKHPEYDLWILNYTKKCQYDRAWDDITIKCRGLIIDAKENIIARPFEKFFNWEELPEEIISKRSRMNPIVQKKLDGSLGILFKWDGKYMIATRGSFNSDQAIYATHILNYKYSHMLNELNTDEFTYLFEIIYPQNKIVVNYGNEEKLVLLDILKISDGSSHLYLNPGFETPEEFKWSSYHHLKGKDVLNEEGYVLKYSDGYRIKIKFDNYVKLHYYVHHISSFDIWQWLMEGRDIYKMIEDLPDEMHHWIHAWVDMFHYEFDNYKYTINKCWNEFKDYLKESRKEFAIKIINNCDKSIRSSLFALADNKFNDSYVWDIIKPIKKQFFKDNNE